MYRIFAFVSRLGELIILLASTIFVRYMLEISTPQKDLYTLQLAYHSLCDSVAWAIRIPDPLEGLNTDRLTWMQKRYRAGGYDTDTTADSDASSITEQAPENNEY